MKLYETLENQLKNEPNFVTDNGELKKWVVIHKAQNCDAELIELLLDNQELKEKFFVDVKGTLVFNQNLFVQFLEQKNYLNDSYTAYRNKVGLSIDGKYLKQRNEVALVWPFKDCILEGGQSREEDKREEIFFNEILAQDEITQLLEPKVLTNAKTYDKEGEHPFKAFTRDAELNKKRGLPENTITDNLIIKGNNLLALHSLKKEFAGKVKLIYIDPPYNTGNDSFGYNDKFNHSSWLTFMKNRLEVARELIKDDGAIFVQIDDKEISRLGCLMDEVYGSENFVCLVTIERSAATGHKAINPTPVNVSDYVFVYAKHKNNWHYVPQFVTREYDKSYKLFIENYEKGYDKWQFVPISGVLAKKGISIEDAIMEFPERIIRFAEPSYAGVGKETRNLIDKSKENPKKIYCQKRDNYSDIFLKNGQRILFYKNKLKEIDGKLTTADALTNIWKDIPFQGIAKEGGVVLLKGKKPEKLLHRIIEISTEKGDIVLDFHLGSGTTVAVTHKINRQYLGLEQLDYGKNDSVVRLKNVINGDTTGISKVVNWKGGGSFTYLELKKYNQTFIEQIEVAQNTETLLQIWEQMKEKSFLNYNVDIKKQEEYIEDFKALSLKEQKQHLFEILDKNQLYVNLSSLNDKDFACTVEEKQVTQDFYQLKK